MKLRWYENNMPDQYEWAKDLFLEEVLFNVLLLSQS